MVPDDALLGRGIRLLCRDRGRRALTPWAARLARRAGAIDFPRARGPSERPTPKLGGLAILAGVITASVIWLPATIHLQHVPHAPSGSGG